MTTHEPNGTLAWRVGSLERQVERLYALEPAVIAQKVSDLHGDMEELKSELKGVRRALWGFGLSFAGGALLLALSAWLALN